MTPQELVGGGFERYTLGLARRFGVHQLNFQYAYAGDGCSLSVCLSGSTRSGEVCLESSGRCRLTVAGALGRPFMQEEMLGSSDERFHQLLASVFLYVSEKRDFHDLWGSHS